MAGQRNRCGSFTALEYRVGMFPSMVQQSDSSVPAGAVEAGGRPAWRDHLAVLLAVFIIKTVVVGWGVYAAHQEALSQRDYRQNYHHHRIIGRWDDPSRIEFFELWVASDAQWYNAIAEQGYPDRGQFDADSHTRRPKLIATTDTQLKYAFFPLWPLTIRAAQIVIPNVDAAGFVAANVLSLAALVILYGFLAHRVGTSASFWAVVLLAASPFGLFLLVPFSESLFLLLTVLTFVTTERSRWLLTGLCVGLGMITRPNGVALAIVPLVFGVSEAVRQPGWLRSQFPRAVGLLVASVPPALFLCHNAVKTGDAFYFTQATDWWGYEESSVWSNLWHNTGLQAAEFTTLPWHGFHRSQLDVIVLATSLIVWLLGLRVVPLHYSAYALAILMIPLLAKDDLMSYSRYALLAWPLFLIPVLWVRDRFRRLWLAPLALASLLLQRIAVGEFVNWHWVG